ncbi:MAG: SsrA-binding protein SmpB [Waddliaceae bacterium]
MSRKKSGDLVSNRKAYHDYEILETYEAGIVLQGTEVKALHQHGGSIQEAYIKILHHELWLVGSHIPPWLFGNIHNHEERRTRKLLMHKREISRLKMATQEKGLTIIPLSIYLKGGRIKVKIAAARGKAARDKRAAIKEKDVKRRMQKAIRDGDSQE